ncbi:RNA 2'-phosphotransferase [Filimonas effusa]|uniref:Probable RNA 2'-phosphotransferase n=1 Tax=Filimonas effusa TaxID=2508721 RepID=A0A4Q1D4I9_9BACT|nr:RNA 2'-phosphotransferase [Filimonas effusa]RXK83258.1 RNA 2'-phosphotransferase [Filimonas effusa]
MTDAIKISKTISHALRHAPLEYNLHLDNEGWVSLASLLNALNDKGLPTTEEAIIEMLAKAEKKRFQILDGKIRAYYGHSIEEKIVKQASEPPEYLYHGTIRGYLESIKEKGLLSMDRQYVHLSIDERTAKIVGSRRAGELVIIKVKAKQAFNNQVLFYKEENGIWLSDSIPPIYLEC